LDELNKAWVGVRVGAGKWLNPDPAGWKQHRWICSSAYLGLVQYKQATGVVVHMVDPAPAGS